MPLLQVSNVSKRYPGRKVNSVNQVSLQVDPNEIIAIVGENGSGKTTLLKLIYGLEDADSGEIFFQDTKVTGPSENLVPGHPQMKIVEQDLNLFPRHTIQENILYDLRLLSKTKQSERLSSLVQLLKLEGLERKIPMELSGGQQQRAALAKAIAAKSPLLLLDEPFSSMDIMLKDDIKKEVIRTAKKEGIAIIFVTHDIQDALSLSDKIAVMKEGEVQQFDTPSQIYERPNNEYIAYLFGKTNILQMSDFKKIFPEAAIEPRYAQTSNMAKVCFSKSDLSIDEEPKKDMPLGTVVGSYYTGSFWEIEILIDGQIVKVLSKQPHPEQSSVTVAIDLTKVHIIEQ
ncbi:ABC transporter ATP-binding protein [Cytophagaceae bacterium ABcell3]|nr:ABC transporter ATP-binding protein [Cytophagaceae bacterium ABcell3]